MRLCIMDGLMITSGLNQLRIHLTIGQKNALEKNPKSTKAEVSSTNVVELHMERQELMDGLMNSHG